MKKFLKKNFPEFYLFLKKVWQSSPLYAKKIAKKVEIDILSRDKRVAEEAKIMREVFADQYVVQNGHFKGMKYINRSSGSALLPKILGSYEEPIQNWIGEIISGGKYSNILDIGCAEGYYACGFAMKMPKANIIGYDTDSEARANSNEMRCLNNLKNVEIRSTCTHSELNEMSGSGTLIFCDIEGFEDVLLDPKLVPNLKAVDLLVELHDFIVPGVTNKMIERFYLTHTMRIVVDYPYRTKKYDTPIPTNQAVLERICDECRPKFMKFIYMESICEKI